MTKETILTRAFRGFNLKGLQKSNSNFHYWDNIVDHSEISSRISAHLVWICKAIAREPDQLKTKIQFENDCYYFYLAPSKSDVGVFIGRGGEMAKALRMIARSVGAQSKVRVELHIDEKQEMK